MNAELLHPAVSYPTTEKDEIVRTHMKLVHKLAKRFRWAISGTIDYQDIVSEGVIGLLQAHKRFDKSKGIKLSTYAIPRIMGSIRNFIRDKGMNIRPPQSLYNRTGTVIAKQLSHSTGTEVSDSLGCSLKQAEESLSYLHSSKVICLDKPLPNPKGNSNMTLIDTLALEVDETQGSVDAFLASLTKVERDLIELRMDNVPLKMIVQQLQKSPDEIHQILICLGEKFSNFKEIKIEREVDLMAELTKERYLELKKQNLSEERISETLLISKSALYRLKQKWGLVGKGTGNSLLPKFNSIKAKKQAISEQLAGSTDSVDWKKKYYDLAEELVDYDLLKEDLARMTEENSLLNSSITFLRKDNNWFKTELKPIVAKLEKENELLKALLKNYL